jgi:gliding motility-associated-like protein
MQTPCTSPVRQCTDSRQIAVTEKFAVGDILCMIGCKTPNFGRNTHDLECTIQTMNLRPTLLLICLLFGYQLQAQYPDARLFHTASAGLNSLIPIGSLDTNWVSALGDITGPTEPWRPSLVCGNCVPVWWYSSTFPNAEWITYDGGQSCFHEHLGCVELYFRRIIQLPPVSECGQYVGDNFCMEMDFYADNDVSRIWVNGVQNHQSQHLDPYWAFGFSNESKVNLCKGWKPGDNELIVHIKSCPGAYGFLAQISLDGFTTNQGLGTVITSFESQKICEGSSYMGYTTSAVYRDTFPGQNGACDTVHALVLEVGKVHNFFDYAQICPGQSYLGYTQPGWHVDTFTTASGCDSIRMLNIEAFPVPIQSDFITICAGQTYQGYNATGVYSDTLQTANGCDSILVTHLNVVNAIVATDSAEFCQGTSYQGYTLPGIYRDTSISVTGCDSIHELVLSVVTYISQNVAVQICAGQTYLGYGTTGQYMDTITSGIGCDTIRLLSLTVLPTIQANFSGQICAGGSFMGYTTAGVFRDTLVSAIGCDSIRVVTVSVFAPQEQQISRTICDGEVFMGHQVSGLYRDTIRSMDGCDSLYFLTDLTVFPVYQDSQEVVLCDDDFLLHSGDTIRTAALFVDSLSSISGCDSVVLTKVRKSEFLPFLPSDTLVCAADKLQIVSKIPNVIWSDGSKSPSIEVAQDGIYFASYTDSLGCRYSDTISVEFIHAIYTPNVFKPANMLNSHFRPFFIDALENYQLEIFDRWGNLVFRTLNLEPGWDGTADGRNASPGVYAYLVRYQMAGCEPQVLSGDVTLIR